MQHHENECEMLESICGSEFTSTSDETEEDFRSKIFVAASNGLPLTMYAILRNKTVTQRLSALSVATEVYGEKMTPLIVASKKGYSKVVEILVNKFDVDVEQIGRVKFDGFVIDGATALWCAAGGGHIDVVKALISAGAEVDRATTTNSTPLRAACFDGRLEVVKYLLSKGANVNVANKYSNTCLMIACYRGHEDVARCLLQHKANLDLTASCGATALHFAAECGHLAIVRDLVANGAPLIKNEYGMTPLLIAADNARVTVVDFFVRLHQCRPEDKIEAYELLATSFANDKDNYNVSAAYFYMHAAMMEREAHGLRKQPREPVAAYGHRRESVSMSELEALKDNHDILHMEALIMRERILGSDNPEVPHSIIFRGAVYADSGRFDSCIRLWLHATDLKHRNRRSISKDLLRFPQVFAQMMHIGIAIIAETLQKVVEFVFQEMNSLETAGNGCGQEVLEADMHTMLYLMAIATKSRFCRFQEYDICRWVYRFCKLDARLVNGYSALHMAVNHATHIDDFHVQDVVAFPNSDVATWLVRCGHDVNSRDLSGNTPLHIAVQYHRPISDFMNLHNIIMLIASAGGHLDAGNGQGKTALEVSATGVADLILRSQLQPQLKCLAARRVRQCLRGYEDQLPAALLEYVNIH